MKRYQRRSRNGAVLLALILLVLIAILSVALPGCSVTYHMRTFVHHDDRAGNMLIFCTNDVYCRLKNSKHNINSDDELNVEMIIVIIGDTAKYVLEPSKNPLACIDLPASGPGKHTYDIFTSGRITKKSTGQEECFEVLFEDIPFETYY